MTFFCFEDKTSCRVLELLKFMNKVKRTGSKKDVTVVEFREDEGAC
jgi:hypothetical protein